MHSPTDLDFRKSSYSNPQNCVEAADVPGGEAALRDSKHPEKGHFTIPSAEWAGFLDAVRQGRF